MSDSISWPKLVFDKLIFALIIAAVVYCFNESLETHRSSLKLSSDRELQEYAAILANQAKLQEQTFQIENRRNQEQQERSLAILTSELRKSVESSTVNADFDRDLSMSMIEVAASSWSSVYQFHELVSLFRDHLCDTLSYMDRDALISLTLDLEELDSLFQPEYEAQLERAQNDARSSIQALEFLQNFVRTAGVKELFKGPIKKIQSTYDGNMNDFIGSNDSSRTLIQYLDVNDSILRVDTLEPFALYRELSDESYGAIRFNTSSKPEFILSASLVENLGALDDFADILAFGQDLYSEINNNRFWLGKELTDDLLKARHHLQSKMESIYLDFHDSQETFCSKKYELNSETDLFDVRDKILLSQSN